MLILGHLEDGDAMTQGRSVGEVIAAAGVILSLIFLGLEIRQNTNAARSATVQALAAQSFEFTMRMSEDPNWIRIEAYLSQAGTSRNDLSAEDGRIQELKYTAALRIMENRLRQYQLGTISEPEITQLGGGARAFYSSPMFREWWASRDQAQYFTADFIAFVETTYLHARP